MQNRPAVPEVLFLCTGNSARSILAEVLLNDLGAGRFRAHSAGSHPAGRVHPGALRKLAAAGHVTAGLAPKSWDRFGGEGAPRIDIVITVCDAAAGESCPVWNGSPVTAHWGIPDPAAIEDEAARGRAFDTAYERLQSRIEALLALPLQHLTPAALQRALAEIHSRALEAER
jgi:arsenate reductase (thioredoxin)